MGGCCSCGGGDEEKKDEGKPPPGEPPGEAPPPPELEGPPPAGDVQAPPPGGIVDLSNLGIEEFRQRLGELAPTVPLIVLFTSASDDEGALSQMLSSLAESYPNVIFLKAQMERNEKAAREFNIAGSPTWMAFKNHVPNGDYVGADQGAVESLVQQNLSGG